MVIVSPYKYENVKNVRMRYFSYFYNNTNDSYELTLNHADDIVTLSVYKVKISNIGMCTILRNMSSYYNTCKTYDIQPLKNLQKIISVNDECIPNKSCLLYDVFTNNKLEYVYVENNKPDSYIVSSFTIPGNIESLRYMYVKYT